MKKQLVILNLLLLFSTYTKAQNSSSFNQDDYLFIKQHPLQSRTLNTPTLSKFSSSDDKIRLQYYFEASEEKEHTQEQYESNPNRILINDFYGDGSEVTQYLHGEIKINGSEYLLRGQYVAEGNFQGVLYSKTKQELYAIADWFLYENYIDLRIKTAYKTTNFNLFAL